MLYDLLHFSILQDWLKFKDLKKLEYWKSFYQQNCEIFFWYSKKFFMKYNILYIIMKLRHVNSLEEKKNLYILKKELQNVIGFIITYLGYKDRFQIISMVNNVFDK